MTRNPYLYRRYRDDHETGLYYLNSRYYNPETGRWINADSIVAGVGGDVKGYPDLDLRQQKRSYKNTPLS